MIDLKEVRNNWFWIMLVGISVVLYGCKTNKNIFTKTSDLKNVKTASDLVQLANARLIDPMHFEGDGYLRFKRNSLDMTFQTLVRIKKDTAIWVVLRKLGFEVARMRINQDSVHLLDRYHREVSTAGTKDLMRYLGLDTQVDNTISVLQDMLIGRVTDLDRAARIQPVDSSVQLLGKLDAGKYQYIFESRQVPEQLLIDAEKFSIQFVEIFSNYKYVNDSTSVFSFDRKFDIEEKNLKTTIEIQFKNIILNEPGTMPFSIPTRYRQKALF